MKRILLSTAIVLIIASCALAGEIKDSIWGKGLDENTLVKMLERGQLLLVERTGWKMSYRNCAELINAPADKVWEVVTDFGKYYKFIPEMTSSKVREQKGDIVVVDFTVKVKIMAGISSTITYDQAYRLKKPIVEIIDPKKNNKVTGWWQVVPAAGGKKALLFYRDVAPDVKEMSAFLAMIMKEKPDLEVALQVSPISVYLTAMKKRTEALYKGK